MHLFLSIFTILFLAFISFSGFDKPGVKYSHFEENKRPAEQKPNIFKNLFLPHIKIGADAEIIQSYLLDHEYEEVLQYGIDQVLGSIKTLQE